MLFDARRAVPGRTGLSPGAFRHGWTTRTIVLPTGRTNVLGLACRGLAHMLRPSPIKKRFPGRAEKLARQRAEAPSTTEAISTVDVDDVAEATSSSDAVADAPETSSHAVVLVDFMQELVRAMRSAAELKHARVDASVAASTEAQVGKVRSRAAAEAAGLRKLGEGDIDGIHDWAKAGAARINKEAARRVGVRRRQLQQHLEQHAALTEREVMNIETAVEVYRSEVEGYFARLTDEPDPTELARLAGMLPEPPDLEQVADEARAEALGAIAGQSDDAATAESGDDPMSAFSPTQAGPGLVAVMTEPGEAHADGNGSRNWLRSLASLRPTLRRRD